PGTTRDVVSCTLDIDGYMVNISDTAGLRDTDDAIEQIGIQRTNDEIKNADLILHVIDGAQNMPTTTTAPNEITVVNKSDLCDCKNKSDAIYVSAKTGDGIDNLMIAIRRRITELVGTGESQLTVNARTRALLTDARTELQHAIAAGDNYDIFSEHVRRAADAIGKILGTITASDVMDATFSQLCLGK
ncbi:MAG: 50S ribosome-binding GTPase, partial [Pseudomonadota bacterium]|nr:50S ribosome-binding GTPase [Pseudomonadota bacterium]